MTPREAYTIKELSVLLGIAPKNVLVRSRNENWHSRPRAKKLGGNEWLMASMPEGTRAAINLALIKQLEAQKIPAKVEQSGVAQLALPMERALAEVVSDIIIPDKAWNRGNARYRIVQEWKAAIARGKKRGEGKMEVTTAFIASVRAGTLLPGILEKAGALTQPTLYRWAKQLKDNHHNPEVLADKRGGWTKGAAKGLGQISIEAEQAFLGVYLKDSQPSLSFAYRAMEAVLIAKGLPVPSLSTVGRFLERFDAYHHDVVVWMREGEKVYNDEVGKFLSRNREILEVGDVLVADGHKMNFTMIDPDIGKPARYTLIGWQDMKSTMFMGFELMKNENTQAIASSFFNSILHLGKLPGCVYIDNGKAFKNKFFDGDVDLGDHDGLYARLGIKVQHSQPYQARSKTIERWWKDFDQQCAVALPSYVGRSIEAKPAHMSMGEKWHRERHKKNAVVPTLEEVKRIIIEFSVWKAQQPHPFLPDTTPWEVFSAGRGPGFSNEELQRMARQFLHRKAVTPKRCRFIISGVEFEADALHGINSSLEAHYSLADLRQVYLHDKGRFVCVARPVATVHAMASLSGNPLDMQTVRAAQRQQAGLRSQTRKLAGELSRQYGASAVEALASLPHMLPALERKRTLKLHETVQDAADMGARSGNVMQKALEGGGPAPLQEKERQELMELSAQLKAEAAAAPTYERKEFYGSELERYEHLFQLSVVDGVALIAEDAAFMRAFEQGPAYPKVARRYDEMRTFFAGQHKRSAG